MSKVIRRGDVGRKDGKKDGRIEGWKKGVNKGMIDRQIALLMSMNVEAN